MTEHTDFLRTVFLPMKGEPRSSMSCLQEPATGPYPDPDEPSSQPIPLRPILTLPFLHA
jgi:hypothetical protein